MRLSRPTEVSVWAGDRLGLWEAFHEISHCRAFLWAEHLEVESGSQRAPGPVHPALASALGILLHLLSLGLLLSLLPSSSPLLQGSGVKEHLKGISAFKAFSITRDQNVLAPPYGRFRLSGTSRREGISSVNHRVTNFLFWCILVFPSRYPMTTLWVLLCPEYASSTTAFHRGCGPRRHVLVPFHGKGREAWGVKSHAQVGSRIGNGNAPSCPSNPLQVLPCSLWCRPSPHLFVASLFIGSIACGLSPCLFPGPR